MGTIFAYTKYCTCSHFWLGEAKLVVLYHHWSFLIWHEEEDFPSNIWHEEEDFPSNVRLSKPKMTTSATLGLGKNYPYTCKIVCVYSITLKKNLSGHMTPN